MMKIRNLFLAILIVAGATSCSKDTDSGRRSKPIPEGLPVHATFSIKLSSSGPSAPDTKNTGDNNIGNDYGSTYKGLDEIKSLDIYLKSSTGKIKRHQFTGSGLSVIDTNGTIEVAPAEPFETTSGVKDVYVVLNDINNIGGNFGPGAQNALIPIDGLAAIESGKDVIMMVGRRPNTTIEAGVSQSQVLANNANKFTMDVARVASRAIVTHSLGANMDFNDGTGVKGTISSIEYSIAQGTNKIYWLIRTGEASYETHGYNYVPRAAVVGDPGVPYTEALTYYDYSDLRTPSVVPVKPPAADDFMKMPGKFLFENVHKKGTDATDTGYRKGNTAYAMITVKLDLDESLIADGGTLSNNGTFYVGGHRGLIYSSMQKAIEDGQTHIRTYSEGKMLYFAWLNPGEVITKPFYSPVVRNNIYHINITGFKNWGQSWNPLYPEDPDTSNPQNPNPKPPAPSPGIGEPENPIDPYDPLYVERTYMDIESTILEWTVNSVDIEF